MYRPRSCGFQGVRLSAMGVEQQATQERFSEGSGWEAGFYGFGPTAVKREEGRSKWK